MARILKKEVMLPRPVLGIKNKADSQESPILYNIHHYARKIIRIIVNSIFYATWNFTVILFFKQNL
jgi:hypothetical protein